MLQDYRGGSHCQCPRFSPWAVPGPGKKGGREGGAVGLLEGMGLEGMWGVTSLSPHSA